MHNFRNYIIIVQIYKIQYPLVKFFAINFQTIFYGSLLPSNSLTFFHKKNIKIYFNSKKIINLARNL